ncbi:MAG: hypothetical protein AB2A00_08585 [Myxococcota bacterium]
MAPAVVTAFRGQPRLAHALASLILTVVPLAAWGTVPDTAPARALLVSSSETRLLDAAGLVLLAGTLHALVVGSCLMVLARAQTPSPLPASAPVRPAWSAEPGLSGE